jgi:hypothetical protein
MNAIKNKKNLKKKIGSWIGVSILGLGLITGSTGCGTTRVSSENLHTVSKQLVEEWNQSTDNYLELYRYAIKEDNEELERILKDYIWDSMTRGNEYKGEFTILEEEWKGDYKGMLETIDRTISNIQTEVYNK